MNKNEIVKRHLNNPILTKDDIPYPVVTVHNAGVIKTDNKYIMLFRSHLHNGRSIIGLAESSNGIDFTASPEPFMTPTKDGIFKEYEEFGVEDPRIVKLEDAYYITYSAYSQHGVRIGLAKTYDFKEIKRIALITQADHRNVVIFPEKINGLYVRMDRPHSEISPWAIWISYSPDLIHWGESRVIIKPVKYHWDEMKIGPGAPPIKTSHGWLNIYHGVFPTMDGSIYRLGVALHDLNDPSNILGISDDWILQPEDPWEITGYVHNVVFSCAAILINNDDIRLYWGGADTVMCTGTVKVKDLINLCKNKSRDAF
jgi:predicted GH43/DUF377 family glycosyl hydrolase